MVRSCTSFTFLLGFREYRRETDGLDSGFKIFKVSVNFTVKMVIEQTLKKSGDDCKGWAATEAVERGDGQWDKVREARSCSQLQH